MVRPPGARGHHTPPTINVKSSLSLPPAAMGQSFSLPQLLGMTDATAIARLDLFESELLLRIVRNLVCNCPAAIGRLICCCKTLSQLASVTNEEGEELRKARRLVARQWLFELRDFAGQRPAALVPLDSQVSRQLSFEPMNQEIDEPVELELGRWNRTVRPAHDDHTRGTALKRVLYANQTLNSVNVTVCYLTYADALEIAQGLKVNKTLTTLNASGNFFGGYGRLHEHLPKIAEFVPMPEAMESIADALSVSTLTTLSLGENRLGSPGIKALVPGLAATSLTSLDLSRNGLGVEGAAALASGLAANSSLLKLDVRLNKLGPAGAQALAPGIAACASLAVLDARFNSVREGDEGEAALIHATADRSPFDLKLHFTA